MTIYAIGLEGIEGYVIEVAVKVLKGASVMTIIGLGDMAIKEAKDRIQSVFCHYGFMYPKGKIVISLSPCDLKKSGSYLDLAMVMALLVETGQVQSRLYKYQKVVFLGAVGLCGELLGFRGGLPMVVFAKQMGYKAVVIPSSCMAEASVCRGIDLIGFESVMEVLEWVEGRLVFTHKELPVSEVSQRERVLDYSQVRGQDELLQYVLAAAAGGHNLLLIGPPGCGKSMIAKRLPSILPNLTEEEVLEVMAIHSLSGKDVQGVLSGEKPFRAPHYNASTNAIIGGGVNAVPGEVSLAHHGVLFLDELPEFSPKVVDALRQPLEDGVVTVARVKSTNTYPAKFMLVGAMNPCKCGHYGYAKCECFPSEISKYQRRISGPVYDRIDIQKFLGPTPITRSKTNSKGCMTSEVMRAKVLGARRIQLDRFRNIPGVFANAHMKDDLVEVFCQTSEEAQVYMEQMCERFSLSRRAYDKILVVARTFADLEGVDLIDLVAIEKAFMARDLDREVKRYGE